MSQTLNLPEFIEQVSQIVFLAYFTVLGFFYHYIKKNVTKLISTRVLWTNITNRVLSRFDRFLSYLNCMSKVITKLISLWVLCTSITDRVLSWCDRCAAKYNCMSKNVTKLYISASSVHKYHKSCSLLIWPFYGLLQQYEIKMSQNWNLCHFCAQVSQNVFLADLTVLQLITTVWAKMSQNSCLSEFCAQASQIVFLVDLTVLRLITTVWRKNSQNSYLCEFCAQVSPKRVFSGFERFTV